MSGTAERAAGSPRDPYAVLAAGTGGAGVWRVLKDDDSFLVLDEHGDVPAGTGAGLFCRDTRYVSGYELRVDGHRPLLLESRMSDDNGELTARLAWRSAGCTASQYDLHLSRTIYLADDALHERLALRSFCERDVEVVIEYRLRADFADIFEVRGQTRREPHAAPAPDHDGPGTGFRYAGRDGVERGIRFDFDPAPEASAEHGADGRSVARRATVRPGETIRLGLRGAGWSVEPAAARARGGTGVAAFEQGRKTLHQRIRRRRAGAARVETSNRDFDRWLERSLGDLYTLLTATPHGPYPYAGIPWYSAPFGRDGIVTALLTLWIDPSIARGVLGFLAATQASDHAPECDAEPGKILHEARAGEMAATGEVPFARYYGGIDSTPLFVLLAGRYLRRTGERGFIEGIWPQIRAALDWIERDGDADRDGFLEYARATDRGLTNQGWKDSVDSIFHADGALARGPIALCEVQGYAYAARREAAAIARELGDAALAERLAAQAAALREAFEDRFWSERLDGYVLALDGDKRRCEVRASNAAHLLLTGIAGERRAARVAGQLTQPDFFSGWGIRTVATTEARYNPLSYHNGSVWPHDTALAALGLAECGFTDEAGTLFEGLFEAAALFEGWRLPELFAGFARTPGAAPIPYPHACAPQAWSAAAVVGMLGASLGLEFQPAAATVRLRRPYLPAFLESVDLHGLHCGAAHVDVSVVREGGEVTARVDTR